jgi:hypothetical protein
VFAQQVSQLRCPVAELARLSETRRKLIEQGVSGGGSMVLTEELKDTNDFASTFAVLSSGAIYQAYGDELKAAFLKNRSVEAEM